MIDPADALSELLGRYVGGKFQICETDIARWTGGSAGHDGEFYDGLSALLARGYHERRYSFEFCDEVVNDLYDYVISKQRGAPLHPTPNLFWRVFAAFDAGEFHRQPDESDDPIAEFTDPRIADIVRGL